MDLFEFQHQQNLSKEAPLADRMRALVFDEYVGQEQIIGKGKSLRAAIERDEVPSMILWGPPGSGKTTLARIIANITKSRFIQFSAVSGSVKDVREIVKTAEEKRKLQHLRTILFVDEIHRFNKSQQDAFLPYVENGAIVLIGATTENPSFELNSALLSRCRVFVLEALKPEDIKLLLERTLKDKTKGLGNLTIGVKPDALDYLSVMANGDARIALNALDLAVKSVESPRNCFFSGPDSSPNSFGKATPPAPDAAYSQKSIIIDKTTIEQSLQRTHLLYDRAGEEHYNIISALHKSMRGSDANAALYWLGRMLEAGEDPLYIARRLIRFASEDIGLADTNALLHATAAFHACHQIGMPECNVILAQCVAYLARAPKSNALYVAYNEVRRDIRELPNEPVPLHLRNAPTNLMKNLGYGKDYKYTPNFKTKEEATQDYLPERLRNKRYLPE